MKHTLDEIDKAVDDMCVWLTRRYIHDRISSETGTAMLAAIHDAVSTLRSQIEKERPFLEAAMALPIEMQPDMSAKIAACQELSNFLVAFGELEAISEKPPEEGET